MLLTPACATVPSSSSGPVASERLRAAAGLPPLPHAALKPNWTLQGLTALQPAAQPAGALRLWVAKPLAGVLLACDRRRLRMHLHYDMQTHADA